MNAAGKQRRCLTAEEVAELNRLNRIADEASARGDHDAASDASHEAMIYLLAIADAPAGEA